MYNIIFIFISLLLTGCLNNNFVEVIKNDFSQEKKANIFNSLDNKSYKIPLNGMIFVKANETIYSIANRYEVIPKNIINDNNLIEPFKLKINQILFLRNKNIHIIKRNETLNNISSQYAVSQSEIVSLNKLKQPYNLIVGNKIIIPIKNNYSIIDKILVKKVYNNIKNYTKNVNFNSNPIKNAPKFQWPLRGNVIKSFGKFGRGQHHDGIDIKAKSNLPIYSSFKGKVAFVGSQIQKFGNLILIKHNNGWLTAYSNVGNFNVKEGDIVFKGQNIASSSVEKGSFHFQLRYNRNPVDPLKYLN